MTASQLVEIVSRDAVATITIRRPDVHNAFNERVAERPSFACQHDEGTDVSTSALIARVRSSDEGREGVRAFLEKRSPRWLDTTDV